MIIKHQDQILEACVETLEEALEAIHKGVDQLEICSRLDLHGLTPDRMVLNTILQETRTKHKVMIRSRAGDFFYSQDEINSMIEDIQMIKALHIDGIVFGALKIDQNGCKILDMNAIFQICKSAFPLPVTIHKAIDDCDDIIAQVALLKSISNVKFILSSGGKSTALEGAETLIKMQSTANHHIDIIAAGKITPHNLSEVKLKTNLKYFHGRKIV